MHAVTILLSDIGNSRLKWSWLDNADNGIRTPQQTIAHGTQAASEAALFHLHQLLQDHDPVQQLILVHVLGEAFTEAVHTLCQQQGCDLIVVNSQSTAYGIRLAYPNPAHFGADRFVGLLATRQLAVDQAAIIVDSGTALTIDAIKRNGEHQGGLILPGLALMCDALSQRTEARHMIEPLLEPITLFANNTRQAMGSGCLQGLAQAVQGICQRMQRELAEETQVILCGGDAERLYNLLEINARLRPDALMDGLHYVAKQEKIRSCTLS
ncbi:MAG: hypothetical protein CR991_07090 [Proteobacteria bacterium]|nr:MAG: hypothetical protein CR991_07090 [Pseudomonadota bacterium]